MDQAAPRQQNDARATGRLIVLSALVVAAVVVAAPILAVLVSLAAPFGETIRHVIGTVGLSYLSGTLALCLAVGAVAGTIGVSAALLTASCEFPGRRILTIALVLPLAAPGYIVAYAYADLLGPFGVFAPVARNLAAIGAPSIKSLPGAVFVLSMTLYPYAYLTARAAFASRSVSVIEAARTLGSSPSNTCLRLLLPMSRAAIVGGVALIMMETAAEFGVADYFGVPTLSVGIFRTWYSFGDLAAASQIASVLFLFAAALVFIEAYGRPQRLDDGARSSRQGRRIPLRGWKASAAALACATPVILGAGVPIIALAAKFLSGASASSGRGLSDAIGNSLAIAGAGAIVTVSAAILFSYADRRAQSPLFKTLIRMATLGYAAPGAVIAIGVLSVFALIGAITGSNALAAAGPPALVYAYCVRFLTAGYNATSGGLVQISYALDDAARTLGATPFRVLSSVHAPLMRRSIVAAGTIVFVDIVKELPATLILRDFNFETLATRVYRLAGDERLAEAAPGALLLIAIGALPVFLFHALQEKEGDAPN